MLRWCGSGWPGWSTDLVMRWEPQRRAGARQPAGLPAGAAISNKRIMSTNTRMRLPPRSHSLIRARHSCIRDGRAPLPRPRGFQARTGKSAEGSMITRGRPALIR